MTRLVLLLVVTPTSTAPWRRSSSLTRKALRIPTRASNGNGSASSTAGRVARLILLTRVPRKGNWMPPLCKLRRQLRAWKRVQTTTILIDGQRKITTFTIQLARTASARGDLQEETDGTAPAAKRSCAVSPANDRTQMPSCLRVHSQTQTKWAEALQTIRTPPHRPPPPSRGLAEHLMAQTQSRRAACQRAGYDDSRLVLGGQQQRLHTQVPLAWRLC